MASRAQLLDIRATLGAAIRSSEPWEESYKRDRATFRRLVEQEQILEADLAEYLRDLAETRLSGLINWTETLPKLKADVVVPRSDDAAAEEERLLIEIILPSYEELLLIGASAGEAIIGVPADLPALRPALLDNARKSTAGLVKGVTDTTRDLIRGSIQSSISRGEGLATMTERVKETINNPVRAQMIAQTETVNAYQAGLHEYALSTGAISKEWEARAGACPVCRPLDGVTVGIDELFTLGNGNQVVRPAAHPRCRCGLIYDYDH